MLDQLSRYEALSGILFFFLVLVSAGAFQYSSPQADASAAKVASFFQTHTGQMRATFYLYVVSAIVGLYFFSVAKAYFSSSNRARHFASLGMYGAVIWMAGGAMQAGLNVALSEVPDKLPAATLQGINVLQNEVATAFIGAGVGLMLLAFGIAIFVSKLLPGWFGWVSLVLGVLSVTASILGVAALGGLLWVLIAVPLLYMKVGVLEPAD